MYGIRYLALGFVSISLGSKLFAIKKIRAIRFPYIISFAFFVFFIPVYGLFVAQIRGGMVGAFIDTSYLAGAVYFLCSILYLFGTNLDKAVRVHVVVLRALCVLIIACLFIVLVGLPLEWIYFFVSNGIAFYGDRSYGGVSFYYIYFIASPMIIFLLAYESSRFLDQPSLSNFGLLCLPVVALFLSGTRANIITSIFGIIVIYFWKRFHFRALIFILGFIVLLILFFLIFDFSVVKDMFGSAELSNGIKLKYFAVYSEIFSDPLTILFGQGFNAHKWSFAFSQMLGEGASKTELTYIEFLRVFGLMGFAGFVFILWLLVVSARSLPFEYQWMAPALLMYLVVSAVNPYIFSSNGMLLFGLYAVAAATSFRFQNRHGKRVFIY